MVATYPQQPPRPLHPLHAILLAFVFPLFLGTLASDIAYAGSVQIQWANFAQWLNAAGLLFGGFALLWALVDLFRHGLGGQGPYFAFLLAAWVVGLVNALVHAKDAWAVMPEGLLLSALAAILALAASWIGYSGFRERTLA